MKEILLAFVSVLCLYFNVWWLIFPLAIAYGYWSERKGMLTVLLPFVIVWIVWSLLLFVQDGSFHHPPSEILAEVGGLSSGTLVKILGGLPGAIIALLGGLTGLLLRTKTPSA